MTAIEVVIYKLKADVSEADFLVANDGIKRFLDNTGKVLKRELLKNEDSTWMDLVYWVDLESAIAANQVAMESPECLPAFAMLDDTSIQMFHFHMVA